MTLFISYIPESEGALYIAFALIIVFLFMGYIIKLSGQME